MAWDWIKFCEDLLIALISNGILAGILIYIVGKRKQGSQEKRIRSALRSFYEEIRDGRPEVAFETCAYLPDEDEYLFQKMLRMQMRWEQAKTQCHLHNSKFNVVLVENASKRGSFFTIQSTARYNSPTYDSKKESMYLEAKGDFIEYLEERILKNKINPIRLSFTRRISNKLSFLKRPFRRDRKTLAVLRVFYTQGS